MSQYEPTVHPRVAQYAVLLVSRILSFYAIMQGFSIVFGGEDRWSARAFAIALLLPGSPPSWGFILLAGGIASLVGSFSGIYRLIAIGHFICATWSVFLSISFAIAAFLDDLASITGVWSYACIAVMYALIGVTYREARKSRGRDAIQCDHS